MSEQFPHPYPPAPGAPRGGGPAGAVPAHPHAHPHPYAHPYPWPGRPPRNGLGTAALVTGVVGLFLGASFLLSPLGVPLGAAAAVLGVVALRRVRAGTATNRGQALAGVWTGVAGVVLSAALSLVLVMVLGPAFPGRIPETVEVASAVGTPEKPASAGDAVAYGDGLTITASPPLPGGAGAPEEGRRTLILALSNEGTGTVDLQGGGTDVYVGGVPVPEGDAVWEREGPDELAPGEGATAELSVEVADDALLLHLDHAPGAAHARAFWEFDLPRPGGGAPGPGDGAPEHPGTPGRPRDARDDQDVRAV